MIFWLRRIFYKFPGLVRAYHYALARWGAVWHRHPSRRIFVIGVTGTKGKTTTLELLNAILEAAGKKTALLSSLRIKIGERSQRNTLGNSMPGRFFLQRFLRKAVKADCAYALIEVTSQGVEMHRHRFIDWNAGVLTNLAPEHIEAHGSFEKYREAKLRFLEYVVLKGGRVFINKDDRHFAFFSEALKNKNVVEYHKGDARLAPLFYGGSLLGGAAGKREREFFLSSFNHENIAAAASVALDLGIGEKIIEEALDNFGGVPGRLEFVRRQGLTVVIDYAHTPDSLEAVYKNLRGPQLSMSGRLICVLGAAGGGRDKGKRPLMGQIAARYCDGIFLTNEDPYDEDPRQILAEIKAGVENAQKPAVREILDRREAIEAAVSAAREADIVVLTGKGSEPYIHLEKGKKTPWNERETVEEIIKKKGGL